MLWIKDPVSEVNLPRYRIIADAISLLDPSDEMWLNYLEELDHLASEEPLTEGTLALFRSEEIMGNILASTTFGDIQKINRRSVKSMLETFTSNVTREKQNEFEEQLKLERENFEKNAEKNALELISYKEPLEQLQNLKNRIIERSEKVGKYLSYFLMFFLLSPTAGIGFGVIVSFIHRARPVGHLPFILWIFVIFYALGIPFFLHWLELSGTSKRDFHNKLSGLIQRWWQRRSFTRLGLLEP